MRLSKVVAVDAARESVKRPQQASAIFPAQREVCRASALNRRSAAEHAGKSAQVPRRDGDQSATPAAGSSSRTMVLQELPESPRPCVSVTRNTNETTGAARRPGEIGSLWMK